MTARITVYEKPTCSKCREVDKILRETGEAYDKINYYVEPLSEPKLRDLLKKLNMNARDLLRTSEAVYKQLNLKDGEQSEEEVIRLMVANPDLIQRPIVEVGERAVLGRPPENIRALLG